MRLSGPSRHPRRRYRNGYDGGNISLPALRTTDIAPANRRDLPAALQPHGLTAWAELNQVHGDVLLFEPEAVVRETAHLSDGDGMAVSRPGLGLLIKTADCQPILLAHKSGRYVAALHAGWRGNRCDFPGTGVARFCARYDLKPCDLFLVVRGLQLGSDGGQLSGNGATTSGPGLTRQRGPWISGA